MISPFTTTLLVAITALVQQCHSLPHNPLPRRVPPYSVVNVDGGRQPTATVIQTVLATPQPNPTINDPPAAPATETVLQTVLVTASSEPETTVIVTFDPVGPSSTPTSITTSTPPSAPIVSIVTIVSTAQPEATQYYDDGLWKTQYPVKSFEEAATATPIPSVSDVASTTEAVTTPTPLLELGLSSFTPLPSVVPSL